jgi:DNA-binding beta-propeller fold protein YncE
VPVRKDPLTELPPDDVVITPDGKTALARFAALAGVRAVDLTTRAITDLTLTGSPTDLELSPDGTLGIAVLRAQNEVDFLPLPDALSDATKIDHVSTGAETAGQVVITADGASGLLFTNATDQKVLIVADLATHALTSYPLEKGVRSVAASPDGSAALIIHNKVPGTPSPTDPLPDYLDKLQGYSLFQVASGYAKLQPTDADPGPFAFTPDGKSGYLLLNNPADAVRSVEAFDLTSFVITSVGLGSPPLAVGVVPGTAQVYVAQDHPLGRMTFVDETTFQARTLTGFGLNGQIIE